MPKRKKRRGKKNSRTLIGALGPGVTLLKHRKAGFHKDKRKKAREDDGVEDLLGEEEVD